MEPKTLSPARSGAEDAAPADATRKLNPAAARAVAEAEERRRKPSTPRPPEINGRDGPDPVRYGDWEVKGVASDF